MAQKNPASLSFHDSHIKWILFTYAIFHILIPAAVLCVYFSLEPLFKKYEVIVYGFAIVELVLAAECIIIRPFLKRFYKSGLSLFYLYLVLRLIINIAAAVFVIIKFPNMFNDLFSLIFSTASNLVNTGMSVLYAAPIFIVCISHIFLCTTSLIYYIRKSNKFNR